MERKIFNVIESGSRLDIFLTEETEFTRSALKMMIEKGNVAVNGNIASKSGMALKTGDVIYLDIPDPVYLSAEPENIPIDIVYEDEDMAVVNKARGMVVHPATGTPNGTLVNALMYRMNQLSAINGVIRPGIVHRLDKNTSGLLVVAKNDAAHLSLAEQIALRTAHRDYIALTDGNWKEDAGEIIAPIGRSLSDRKKMAVVPNGRFAKTNFHVETRYGEYTLLKFRLDTGRTHQIRVHAAYKHHPVVGDAEYGGSDKFKVNGQLLHAYHLELTHPRTGERMDFKVPIPEYFAAVLYTLKPKE